MHVPSLRDKITTAKTHINAGELDKASAILKQAGEEHENDAEVWFLLGLVESQQGNPVAATGYFRKTIGLNPDSVGAHYNLALAQSACNRLNEAAASLRKCLALNQAFTPAHLKISGIYEQLGDQEKALQNVRKVLDKEPRNTLALIRSARIQAVFGNMEAARKAYLRAIETEPGSVAAVSGLADIYAKEGSIAAGLELLEPFINGTRAPAPIAMAFANICQTSEQRQLACELLENILADCTVPESHHRSILMSLARLDDRSQSYDRAFERFSLANRMKEAEVDMDDLANQTNHFIDTWTPSFHDRLAVANVQIGRVQPVFVLGMPRSGTTLVEQILAGHPLVYGAGEIKDIGNIMMTLSAAIGTQAPYPECLEYASTAKLNELANQYLDKLSSVSGGGYSTIIDKLPANFWNLGLIKRLFPSSTIIHCTRNPLDTCLSCYFTDFAEGNLHSFDLGNMGLYYRQYQKIMHHWKDTLDIPMLEAPYEEVVTEPEHWSRRLVEYCGLEWDDRCLDPHKTRRDVATASFMQVRQRVYTSSIDRWKNYSKHIGPLRDALGDHGI